MTLLPTFDVLGLGAVAVDELLYVDEYPPAESKVRVRRRLRQCGGLTGTALVAAARLGARCAYAGLLGDDELSRFVAEGFSREGIDVAHCTRRSDARPAHSTIVVDGRRTRTIFSYVEGALGPDKKRPPAELIRSSRVLLIDHHGVEGTLRAVKIARRHGVGVVADFERHAGGRFDELLGLVDHLIISRRFARELTSLDDPARAAEKLFLPAGRVVVVTCGAEGCWYAGGSPGQAARHVPAFEVEVHDTTGCGDVFHGAYAASLARGEELPRRIIIATAAAALKATHPGGQSGCPTRQTVEQFLAERL
ncbi:MAG TPA: PfkB family carbohydrate kinase [Thermoguttaceae bacterium]|nr:PfkB family carbohydrate kinase [Thermoguttaceae bacterium]